MQRCCRCDNKKDQSKRLNLANHLPLLLGSLLNLVCHLLVNKSISSLLSNKKSLCLCSLEFIQLQCTLSSVRSRTAAYDQSQVTLAHRHLNQFNLQLSDASARIASTLSVHLAY